MNQPTTTEVLAHRKLNRSVDERWVEWATNLLVQGHDSPTLRVMAGEAAPFDSFEMWAMTDRVVEELGLVPFESELDAAVGMITACARGVLAREITVDLALTQCRDLYLALDSRNELTDFYLLYHAYHDLLLDENQSYWPGADRNNIGDVIDEQCRLWLAAHPDEP